MIVLMLLKTHLTQIFKVFVFKSFLLMRNIIGYSQSVLENKKVRTQLTIIKYDINMISKNQMERLGE